MKREYAARSYTVSYHAGNAEQMNERVDYAHSRLIDEMGRAIPDWRILTFTTSTAVDNETGRTTVTMIVYRDVPI